MVIRRLQADMQFSAAGESFQMKYVWQSLRDLKTWVASERILPFCLTSADQAIATGSGNVYGIVGHVSVSTISCAHCSKSAMDRCLQLPSSPRQSLIR